MSEKLRHQWFWGMPFDPLREYERGTLASDSSQLVLLKALQAVTEIERERAPENHPKTALDLGRGFRQSVGVGELESKLEKYHVWKTRIQLDRYQDPLVVTIAVPQRTIDPESSQQARLPDFNSEFDRELTAFRRLQRSFQASFPGHFVALKNGRMIDHDSNEQALATRVQRTHRKQFVLIRHVDLEHELEGSFPSPEVRD
jgi:hypothetical protein